MRRLAAATLVALPSACAAMHGPQAITLSTAEIERQIRADSGTCGWPGCCASPASRGWSTGKG
jgi:hypothetical protein